MFRIWKIWSEDEAFKPIIFKPGINLIVGDASKDDEGNVSSEKRNGAGKSLSIELINFCLLKRENESRISGIPDEYLPLESFVYLRFQVKDVVYIIGRNKKGEIRFKVETEATFKEYDAALAKKELNHILDFNNEIGPRAFFNFVIKESSYNYRDFLEMFRSSYLDSIKPSLYFFGITLDSFNVIDDLQDESDLLEGQNRAFERKLEAKGTDILKLRSLQVELEEEVTNMQDALDYTKLSENISDQSLAFNKMEEKRRELDREKHGFQLALAEIEEFLLNFNEDLNIDDDDLKTLFDNYAEGLGEFIQKDFQELREFRNQVLSFKKDLLNTRKEELNAEIEKRELQIEELKKEITKYEFVVSKGKNLLQKNLQYFQQKNNEFEENKELLSYLDSYETRVGELQTKYNKAFDKFDLQRLHIKKIETSFLKTFKKVYKEIYNDEKCSFGFRMAIKRDIRTKKYFTIEAHIDKEGSEGRNRTRAVIYDFSLLTNENTKANFRGFMIHDRLLFGDIDKDTTINILNFLADIDDSKFQYIGTMNTDDITSTVEEKLKFKIKDKARITLTIEDPLFHEQFSSDFSHPVTLKIASNGRKKGDTTEDSDKLKN